ncbi:type VI secretion system-associated protein TagF [Catenovulum sp. SM1970]|uniref:type VI secretion system-associated protein TagF n=1 Tax=Marinifaba aquimaris TaxID=2741323 RepID=UPI0015724EFD|nr:type VI secretion system-associated protein TagF [Marinifaba aquimaris]NTS75635.1 type VI secretion system-associated protein TagF [Marinifaba aquimaris]
MKIGFFGKLPSFGDFIYRNVAPELIQFFDNWLKQSLDVSMFQLGEHWHARYLHSPIWCFSFQAGVASPNAVTGLMMQSVDKAGRCYPFIVLCEAEQNVNMFAWSCAIDENHKKVEDFLISLLGQKDPNLEQVLEVLQSFYPESGDLNVASHPSLATYSSSEIGCFSDSVDQDFNQANEAFLEQLLALQQAKVTLWWMTGGVGIAPMYRYFSGMPPVDTFSSFLVEAGV